MDIMKARRGFARATTGLLLSGLLASCSYGPTRPAPVYNGNEMGSGWSGPPPRGSYVPPPRSYGGGPAERSYAPRPLGGTALARPLPPLSPAPSSSPPGPTASLGPPLPPPPGGTAPAGPPPGAGTRITVTPGQSLGYLAQRYHVSERAIIEANNLRPPYKIEIGQQLLIPGSAGPMVAETGPGNPPPEQPGMAGRGPGVIPLDGPPPAAQGGSLSPPRGEESVAEEARADSGAAQGHQESAVHGGRFPWPVRGRVIGNYGIGPGGAKNDGINIAAPLGTPVRAIEGGEVAYAGNELKGYGNLILIKHPDGWISAYAHCQELLVHKGERVRAGQVIAKVGNTGGVRRPQLHFELRRGERPVNPREFLAPAPSAANGNSGEG